MKYLQMDIGILEPVKRTIFYHPSDRMQVDYLVKSDDIIKIHSKWLERGQCIITKDIIVEPKITIGLTYEDFINNEMTVVCELIFI